MRFQGTLEGVELGFVIEYGLNGLMAQGAIPFVHRDNPDVNLVVPTPEGIQ